MKKSLRLFKSKEINFLIIFYMKINKYMNRFIICIYYIVKKTKKSVFNVCKIKRIIVELLAWNEEIFAFIEKKKNVKKEYLNP